MAQRKAGGRDRTPRSARRARSHGVPVYDHGCPACYLAMGRDLHARHVQLGRDSLRRVMAPRFTVPPTAPSRRTAQVRHLPRRRRRSSRLRPLMGLVGIVLLLVALQSGIAASVLRDAIVKVTDASGPTASSVRSAGGTRIVAPPTAAAAKPALLSCSSLDVSRLKYVKNRKTRAQGAAGGLPVVDGFRQRLQPHDDHGAARKAGHQGIWAVSPYQAFRRQRGARDLPRAQHLRAHHVGLGRGRGPPQGGQQDGEGNSCIRKLASSTRPLG